MKSIKIKKDTPVTVLSGFLGAGKTTLLNNILTNRKGLKIAVIVNDMAELNVDAELVKDNDLKIERKEEKLIELSNGCICCTLREDLLVEVSKLAKENKYDAIVIESSGISEPLQVAETFTFEDDNGDILNNIARLDTMVTLVDTLNFFKNFNSESTLSDMKMGIDKKDERTLTHLLTDQVEFANIIILSKIDLAKKEDVIRVKELIYKLNPDAKIIESANGNVDINEIVNTKMFSMEKASDNSGWLKEIRGEHVPETLEYGISSFVYQAKIPFDSEKLDSMLQQGKIDNVLRSKGFAWLDKDIDFATLWNHSGKLVNLTRYGYWKKDKDKKPKGSQRIVFIGQNLHKEELTKLLDSCLISA